jgi:hypothetical protein
MAARLVEESSPLGVELRRQLAADSPSPDPTGQRATAAASGSGDGAIIRRTPRRLLSPRATAAAAAAAGPTSQQLRSVPWVGADGGTPRRPASSDDDSPVAPSPGTPIQAVSPALEDGDSKVAVVTTGTFGAPLTAPQIGLTPVSSRTRRSPVPHTQSAADAAASIACDAAAAACDAAAAVADASRKGRAEALEKQVTASAPLAARKVDTDVNLNSPRQLRRAEEELEDRIDALQRCVRLLLLESLHPYAIC